MSYNVLIISFSKRKHFKRCMEICTRNSRLAEICRCKYLIWSNKASEPSRMIKNALECIQVNPGDSILYCFRISKDVFLEISACPCPKGLTPKNKQCHRVCLCCGDAHEDGKSIVLICRVWYPHFVSHIPLSLVVLIPLTYWLLIRMLFIQNVGEENINCLIILIQVWPCL